ncbi:SNF2 family N-terminal domain-containing protein [Nemania sp. NC0429]|nr:SNF2 family N-terminal domain-containing protein [Nemania sp. NC0429]
MHFTLDVNFNTATHTFRNSKQRVISQHILDVLSTDRPNQTLVNNSITAHAFYNAAFMPSRYSFNELEDVQIPGLEATLYPFQRRTVQWLLMRERVKYSNTGPDGQIQLTAHPEPPQSILPFSFHALNDANGQKYYMSDLFHVVARDIAPFQELENKQCGGILAEEMGLGKTVEIISLVLAHRRGPYAPTEFDPYTAKVVTPTGATLIVTPDTLQNQWLSEFEKHAPSLRVMKYPGVKVWANDKTLNMEHHEGSQASRFISKLTNCDVVITTYTVLQTEIHYAMAPPERSMRYEKRRERQTSPLVQIGWWRICLDEAQQIDSGVSSAAKVARLIPRLNAWAVTGTPVKDDPNDLWGLLLFLRYEPFASDQVVWKALLKTHQTLFDCLFNKISIRHCKQAVHNELKLPSQKRYVVNIPFTAIEDHHYHSQFRALVAKAGLGEQGIPLRDSWDPDDSLVIDFMKKALANLRQTILHPELGSGTAKPVAYKTLAEHLETLIDHSEASIKTHQRSYLIVKLNRGQLLENSPRVTEALEIWQNVLEEVKAIVLEAREDLRKALENAQQEQSKRMDGPDDRDPPDDELLETPKIGECRRRLRLFLDLQHRATFFIASAYFQIKSNETLTKPGSDDFVRLERLEVEGYEVAQKIRREILQEPLAKASRLMKKLQERADTQSFAEIPEIIPLDLRGIESGNITEGLEIVSAFLNEQANVLDEWREHVIQLLLKPLVDTEDEDEITGEEYEDSTKVQDHLIVYTIALGTMLSDRIEALTGLVNERIRYETTTAEDMARRGEGHAPEKLSELFKVRQMHRPQVLGNTFRGIVAALRELSTKLRHDASAGSSRARVELEIVTAQLKATQNILTKQSKASISLGGDLDFFSSAMNARIEFYRQLQSVSDNVAPLDPELSDNFDQSWANYLAQEADLKKMMQNWQSNRRHQEGFSSSDPCAICGDSFILGAITTCGHTFCKECIVHWLRSKHRCPMCKASQNPSMLSEFSNRSQARSKGRSLGYHGPNSPGFKREWQLYSDIPENQSHAIQNVQLDGPSYSSKIDTLIKHLLWLREEDPGAKSIIFTQFRSFLGFLEQALARHRIGFASFTNKAAGIQKFKDDPSVECLLMGAKAHSSGLNLVNASHVFICEPLLNTALELQAIARVDRIGQEHETTVWLYLVKDTVEENIHAISERRRLAHMGRDPKGKSKETTESELLATSFDKLMGTTEDGEVVDKGDLWECLFGNVVPA